MLIGQTTSQRLPMSTPLLAPATTSHAAVAPHMANLVKERDEKAEKELPFSLPLNEDQQKLLQSIATKKYPLPPKYSTWTTYGETIEPPTLSFSALELCNLLNAELAKKNLPCDEMSPFITGGAASHLMGGPGYADVDLCYYIKKADFMAIKDAVIASVAALLKIKHGLELSSAELQEIYLYRKKLLREKNDLSSFFGLGGIDIKFIYSKLRQNVSTADSFIVALFSPIVRCVQAGTWGNAEEFHAAEEDLKNRKFVVKFPHGAVGLIYRMAHKLTQGFSVDPEVMAIALKQLQSDVKARGLTAITEDASRHTINHYGYDGLPKFLDLLNFIALLNKLPLDTDKLAERHIYVHTLAKAWIKNSAELDVNFMYIAHLLHSKMGMGEHFLAFMRGMLLCRWLRGEAEVSAYAQPKSTQPSMHLFIAHATGTHSLYLEHTPERIAIEFIHSWSAMHRIFSTKRDIHYISGMLKALSCLPFTPEGQKKSFSLLCTHFDAPPLTSLWEKQFKGKDCARTFYTFTREHLAENPMLLTETSHILLKLAKINLERHIDELLALREKRTCELIKEIIACLECFVNELLYSEQAAKMGRRAAAWLSALHADKLKAEEKVQAKAEERKEEAPQALEKLDARFTPSAKLSEDLMHAIHLLLEKSVERRHTAALPALFHVSVLAESLGIFSQGSQRGLFFPFIQALSLEDTFPAWANGLLKSAEACGMFKHKPTAAQHQMALLSFLNKISLAAPQLMPRAHALLHNLLEWFEASTICPKDLLDTALLLMRRSIEHAHESSEEDCLPEAGRSCLFQTFLRLHAHKAVLANLSNTETNSLHETIYGEALKEAAEASDKEGMRLAYRAVEQIVNAYLRSSPFFQNLWGMLNGLLQRPLKKSRIFYDFILRHIEHLLSKQAPHSDFHPPLLHAIDRISLFAEDPQYKMVRDSFLKMAFTIKAQLCPKLETKWHHGALERSLKRIADALRSQDLALQFPKVFAEFVNFYAAWASAEETPQQKDLLELQKLELLDFQRQRSHILYTFISVIGRVHVSWAQAFLPGAEAYLHKDHRWNLILLLIKKQVESADKELLLQAYDLCMGKQRVITDTYKALTATQLMHLTYVAAELLKATFQSEEALKSVSIKWERTAEILIQMLQMAKSSLEPARETLESLKLKMRESLLSAAAAILRGERAPHFACAEKLIFVALQEKHLIPSDVKQAYLSAICVGNRVCQRHLATSSADADILGSLIRMIKVLVGLHQADKQPLPDEDLSAIFTACQILSQLAKIRQKGEDGHRELLSAQTLFTLFLGEKETAKKPWNRDIIDLARTLVDALSDSKESTNSLLALKIGQDMASSDSFTTDMWSEDAERLFNKLAAKCLTPKKGTTKLTAQLMDILEKLMEKEFLPRYSTKGLLALTQALIQSDLSHSGIKTWDLAWKILPLSLPAAPTEHAMLKQSLFQALDTQIKETQNGKLVQMLHKWHNTQSTFDPQLDLQLIKGLCALPKSVQAKLFPLKVPKKSPEDSGERLSAQALCAAFLSETEKCKMPWTKDILEMVKALVVALTDSKEETDHMLALQIGQSIACAEFFTADMWNEAAEALFESLASRCLGLKKNVSQIRARLTAIAEQLMEKELMQCYSAEGLRALTQTLISADRGPGGEQLYELAWKILQTAHPQQTEMRTKLQDLIFHELNIQISKTQNLSLVQMLQKWYSAQLTFDPRLYMQIVQTLTTLPSPGRAEHYSFITRELTPSLVYEGHFSKRTELHPSLFCTLLYGEVCFINYLQKMDAEKFTLPDQTNSFFIAAFEEEKWINEFFTKKHASTEKLVHFPKDLQATLIPCLKQIAQALFQLCMTTSRSYYFERAVKFIQDDLVKDYKSAFLATLQMFCRLSISEKRHCMRTSLLELLETVEGKEEFLFLAEDSEGLVIFEFLIALSQAELGDFRWEAAEKALMIFGKSRLPWMLRKVDSDPAKSVSRPPSTCFRELMPKLELLICRLIPLVIEMAAPTRAYMALELLQGLTINIVEVNESLKALKIKPSSNAFARLKEFKLKYFAEWVLRISMHDQTKVSEAIHIFTLYLPDYARQSKAQGLQVLGFIALHIFKGPPQWTHALLYALKEAQRLKLFENLPSKESQEEANYLALHIHVSLFSLLSTHKYASQFGSLLEVFKSLMPLLAPHILGKPSPLEIFPLHVMLNTKALSHLIVHNNASGIETLFDSLTSPSIASAVPWTSLIQQFIFVPAMFYHCKQRAYKMHSSLSSSRASPLLLSLELQHLHDLAADPKMLLVCVDGLISNLPARIQAGLVKTLQDIIIDLDEATYSMASKHEVTLMCIAFALRIYLFLKSNPLKHASEEGEALVEITIQQCLSTLPESAYKKGLLQIIEAADVPQGQRFPSQITLNKKLNIPSIPSRPLPCVVNTCPCCPDLSPSDLPSSFLTKKALPEELPNFMANFLSVFPEFKKRAKNLEDGFVAISSEEAIPEIDLKEDVEKKEASGKEEASKIALAIAPLKTKASSRLAFVCSHQTKAP